MTHVSDYDRVTAHVGPDVVAIATGLPVELVFENGLDAQSLGHLGQLGHPVDRRASHGDRFQPAVGDGAASDELALREQRTQPGDRPESVVGDAHAKRKIGRVDHAEPRHDSDEPGVRYLAAQDAGAADAAMSSGAEGCRSWNIA